MVAVLLRGFIFFLLAFEENDILFQTSILQFQKRKYAKMMSDRFGRKGFGLRMLENISAGQFLIEYVGEVSRFVLYYFNVC